MRAHSLYQEQRFETASRGPAGRRPHRLGTSGSAAPDLDADALSECIHAGGVLPFYQPIVSPVDGRLCGVEVLARLRLRDGRILDARDFIPVAESSGLIHILTEDLVARIAEHKQRLRRLGLQFLSVNLSYLTLERPRASELASLLVAELGDSCRLILELSSGMACRDPQRLQHSVAQMRMTGALLAIDDFGAGHSSARALAVLPVSIIKVDMAFSGALMDLDGTRQLLQSILAVSRCMGLKVIAEGVETPLQRRALVGAGIDYAQGYLFGRPVELTRLERRYDLQSSGSKSSSAPSSRCWPWSGWDPGRRSSSRSPVRAIPWRSGIIPTPSSSSWPRSVSSPGGTRAPSGSAERPLRWRSRTPSTGCSWGSPWSSSSITSCLAWIGPRPC